MENRIQSYGTILMGIFILAVAVISVVQTIRLPESVPATAPATEFSAERAERHITAIAAEPHPVGSRAIEGTARYIEHELISLGLRPEVQTAVMNNKNLFARCRNILVRIEGTSGNDAILLAAHYDSVPFSPGAADDGIGVSTLLEIARALTAGSGLKNDVIILFTNPEETGLQGARAFAGLHPWAADVRMAVNLDAGGISGPAYLSDTSAGNGRLIREYAEASPGSIGNGAGQSFGNPSSDFDVFKAKGYQGFFIALVANRKIHSELDTAANSDIRSLQQMGDTVLSIVNRFGNQDLNRPAVKNAVYFNLGSMIIFYPTDLVFPFMGITLLLFACVIWIGFKRRHLTFSGTILGTLVFLVTLVLAAFPVFLLWQAVSGLHPVFRNTISGHTYNDPYFRIAFIGMAAAVIALAYGFSRNRISVADLSMGSLFIPLPVMIAFSITAGSASYIMTIPLFFSLLALGFRFLSGKNPDMPDSLPQLVLFLAGACVAVVLFIPPVTAGFLAFDPGNYYMMIIALMLLFAFLVPHLLFTIRTRMVRLSGAVVLAGIVFLVIGLTVTHDEKHPRLSSAFYIFDSDNGRAFLGSGSPNNENAEPEQWTAGFLTGEQKKAAIGSHIPGIFLGDDTYYMTDAPVIGLPLPQAELTGQETTSAERVLTLHFTPDPDTSVLSAYKEKNQVVDSVVIDGIADPKTVHPEVLFIYHDPPPEGINVTVRVKTGETLKLILSAQVHGLPAGPDVSGKPLPPDVIPFSQASPFAWKTTVIKRFSF